MIYVKSVFNGEDKDRIKMYLDIDLEYLKFLQIKMTIVENKIDEQTRNLPWMIAILLVTIGILMRAESQVHWVDLCYDLLTGIIIFIITRKVRQVFNAYFKTKSEVEIIKYCIKVKEDNKEKQVLKIVDEF